MVFIVNKNMPEEMTAKLCGENDRLIKTQELSASNLPLSVHPDIQLHKISDTAAYCAPECYEYYRSKLPDYIELFCGESEIGVTYPGDCSYNISRLSKYVFANTKYADKKILNYYSTNGYNIIHVNQGYTACNSLIIGSTLLTEDVGIHNTIMVNDLNIKCELLPYGEVELEKFPYGFIGGTAGSFGNMVYFCGEPSKCSYCNVIDKVLKAEGVKSIALSDGPLHDFGGIICFADE